MTSRKTLLLLGGSIYLVRAIEAVRDAGYRTVVVDRDPAAPGLAVADVGRAIDVSDAPARTNGPEVSLRVRTVSGDVRISRAAEAVA